MSNPSPLPDPIGEIQAKYGEPWRAPYMGGIVLHREQMDRAIACVNALAGIADPAAHLSTLAATVERLEAERERMARWMSPLVRLSLGLDYHECKIVDVGHSEIVLMIECPDAAEQLASVTSERDAALAEVGRLAAIVERLTTAGVPAIEMLGAFMPTGNDDASLKLKRDLADVANGLASAAALAPTPERTEPNEAR